MRRIKENKPLVWLRGEIKTPPFSYSGRLETGHLLRLLQQGESLGLPHSRPLPTIGIRCHELRINDEAGAFRILYRVDDDAIVILNVFLKKTRETPRSIIADCKRRIHQYDTLSKTEEKP